MECGTTFGYVRAGRGAFRKYCSPQCQWKKHNRGVSKRTRRHRHLYGIQPEVFERMVVEQAGRCGGCDNVAALVVDHDHGSGAVRGLLCVDCNFALGFLRDDPARAEGLAAYLRRSTRNRP